MSSNNLYRLTESAAAEPLINSWAVWSDLVSPSSYSLHLLNYQVKILSSYLASPTAHAKASKNPAFISGPFMNVPAERVKEVEGLLKLIEETQSENIKFARALTDFSNFINHEAQGQSLEPYYKKIPESLRGYVELVYDYNNHPIVRLMESLLYRSSYYRKNLQSLRIFQQTHDSCRPFFLNTPRLPAHDQIDWARSFDDSQIDEFFRLESTFQPLGRIRELLCLTDADDDRLLPLLTERPVEPTVNWRGPGGRIRYFGHACVLVEWQGVSILIDPWIGLLSQESEVKRLSYKDLPEKIDYVLITHGHHDHFVIESLLRLRHRIECLIVPRTSGLFYADASLKLLAQNIGFKQVVEMEPLDSIKLSDGEIVAVPFFGEHADLPHGKVGYLIRAGKEQVLFAADSNCLDKCLYKHLRRILGPIQTVFLGMECVGAPLSWLYGALLPTKPQHGHDQSRRTKGCDAQAAFNLLEAVGSNRVYIYALGMEPWLRYGMGLGLSEDSVQLQEAKKVISGAAGRNFVDARRLYGMHEIRLG